MMFYFFKNGGSVRKYKWWGIEGRILRLIPDREVPRETGAT